jgi:hypothetical protein
MVVCTLIAVKGINFPYLRNIQIVSFQFLISRLFTSIIVLTKEIYHMFYGLDNYRDQCLTLFWFKFRALYAL